MPRSQPRATPTRSTLSPRSTLADTLTAVASPCRLRQVRSVSGALPPTAVHVALEDMPAGEWPSKRVTHIGKHVPLAGGIEAGLYRCDHRLFAALASLSTNLPYFTVAQAMQLLASEVCGLVCGAARARAPFCQARTRNCAPGNTDTQGARL